MKCVRVGDDESQWKLGYDNLLKSGMFWEWFPTLTGVWDTDKAIYCGHIEAFCRDTAVRSGTRTADWG